MSAPTYLGKCPLRTLTKETFTNTDRNQMTDRISNICLSEVYLLLLRWEEQTSTSTLKINFLRKQDKAVY
ncbi:unnamed protein product [Gulo gulo]|uniref:Uncharacterized protein n=1 Tax=Gulo gulo TaxID=48420 RepID=A0A9X9QA50_GULGU|nr:unnamed protein product [Gulo gulo]